MADWIVCPSCNLRHTRRPTGACPRCRQAVDRAEAVNPVPPVVLGTAPKHEPASEPTHIPISLEPA